ncbi:MAG: glyoxalase [Calditrichaeota bacterium]|jgi:hypothetical protein|nr:glyoxalase [Calditrichota bacterium]MBT7616365.1 glyoxalase [Calditrichota bacterium]MBT7788190.1 glyoxalase [Calditrichota bacterium]
MKKTFFILYVADQSLSTEFYTRALGQDPALNVPGMTEFSLSDHSSLGLMPVSGIKQLLGDPLPDPIDGIGIPRAELYLHVDNPTEAHQRALSAGAKELSPLLNRDWGDSVAYSLDLDGHVLAFAEPI